MARGRMINQKIAEDIDFNGMSIDAQFLFMRAIPFLDRDGLIWGHPGLLANKIAPLLPQYGSVANSVIDEWIENGFAIKYMDGKTPVLFFKGFNKNQSLTHYDREAASTFAPPPGYHRTPKGLKPIETDNSSNPPTPEPERVSEPQPQSESKDSNEKVLTDAGLTPDELPTNSSRGRGMEVEVKEKERGDHARAAEPVAELPQPPPPSSSIPTTGDPYMDVSANRFNQRQADGHRKAKRASCWPELDKKVAAAIRLPLVERLIDIHGLRELIDKVGDDDKLADMHQLAADLYVMGFTTVTDIDTVHERFRRDWKGKTPSGRQLAGIASTMKQEKLAPLPGMLPTANSVPGYKRVKALN